MLEQKIRHTNQVREPVKNILIDNHLESHHGRLSPSNHLVGPGGRRCSIVKVFLQA